MYCVSGEPASRGEVIAHLAGINPAVIIFRIVSKYTPCLFRLVLCAAGGEHIYETMIGALGTTTKSVILSKCGSGVRGPPLEQMKPPPPLNSSTLVNYFLCVIVIFEFFIPL